MADVDFGKLLNAFTPIHNHACGQVGDTCLDNILFTVINIMLYIGGIAAILAILYGGIMYITSGGDEAKAAKGRASAINGVIGMVIILLSWAIMAAVGRIVNA
jgi:hypothetical protein